MFTQRRPIAGQWRPRALCWQWDPKPDGGRSDQELACLRLVLADTQKLAPGLAGEGRFWPLFLISLRINSLRHLAGAVFQDQPVLALAAMDRVLELGGDRPTDYLNRGLLQQRLGHHAAALTEFARCLQRDPAMELANLATVYSQVYLMVEEPAARLGDYCASP